MGAFTREYAHVKWFLGDPNVHRPPLDFGDVVNGSFLFWLGITLAGLLLTAVFNERLQRIGFVAALHGRLDRAKPYAPIILRAGLGLGLLLQLGSAAYLAPELTSGAIWIRIALNAAILGLLSRKTLVVSGAAIALLYVQAIRQYGLFHALDYMFYIGIIYYLLVAESRWKETALPVLYLFTGLSLAWVAMEKLTMPGLAQYVLFRNQVPTFGFSSENFILIAAFVELGLAWTFIVGILNRFVSILVTLVFISTTLVFGYNEVVGHTILHTLLIVFLLEGEGAFKTPFRFHHAPLLRWLFVLVNFCVLLFGMMAVYIAMAP